MYICIYMIYVNYMYVIYEHIFLYVGVYSWWFLPHIHLNA